MFFFLCLEEEKKSKKKSFKFNFSFDQKNNKTKKKLFPLSAMSFVYVSMTSIPSRLPRLLPIIQALLTQQTFPFRKLLLYLPFYCVRLQQIYEIPQQLLDLQNDRFEIRRVSEDSGPATKVLPAMRDLLEDKSCSCVISVDDDVFLDPHAVEELVLAHRREPHAVLGFMGVIPPHFFHGDRTVSPSFEVQLLGGYRAILYPSFVFESYWKLFSYVRHKLTTCELPWPLSIMDDDYLFASFARAIHVPCKVIYSHWRRNELNFRFDTNSDGVSGQEGSDCYIHRSRAAIDSVLQSLPTSDVRMLHIICNSPRNATRTYSVGDMKNTKIITHPDFDFGIPSSTLISYLKCLFHPQIHVVQQKKYSNVDYVLISSWPCIVDTKRMYEVARWHSRMLAFNPPASQMEIGFFDDDDCYSDPILMPMQDIKNLICADDAKTSLLSSTIISWTPRDLHWPNIDTLRACGCVWANHVAYAHWFQKHCAKREVSQKVLHVFYGTNNITKQLREICFQTTRFQLDGSNAQMDNLFGDPAPNIHKSIFIQMQDGKLIEQNTDWIFWLENDCLMVQ